MNMQKQVTGGCRRWLCSLLIVTLTCLGNADLTARERLPQVEESYDAGDYYLLPGGKKVHLLRAANEVAVRVRNPQQPKAARLERLQRQRGDSALEVLPFRGKVWGGKDVLEIVRSKGVGRDAGAIAAAPDVSGAYPVYVAPNTQSRAITTGEVLVGFEKDIDEQTLITRLGELGLEQGEKLKMKHSNVYRFTLKAGSAQDVMQVSLEVSKVPGVRFAEPNLIQDLQLNDIPNDAQFSRQQALRNIGQNGALTGADVRADAAWNINTGDQGVVIAILDTGVDTGHADLRIFTNPSPDPVRNDLNGWDFVNNDNNPEDNEGHGTACAGIAAAMGNNGIGITGIARQCTILPVKIADWVGGITTFVGSDTIAEAIDYAASLADVLSNSYSIWVPSTAIDTAISDAVENGRNGQGCPVFFATGNSASRWDFGGGRRRVTMTSQLPAGAYSFGFTLYTDSNSPAADEFVAVDNVALLTNDGYTVKNTTLGTGGRQDFEGQFPPAGWFLAPQGQPEWHITTDNAFAGTGGIRSARSGAITANAYTELHTPIITVNPGEILAFDLCLSSRVGHKLFVDVFNSQGTYLGGYEIGSGGGLVNQAIGYPASSPDAIRVGAATDRDLRSDYSQFGPELDFLAPSNGGFNDVISLDPRNNAGRSADDINRAFGGTSAASPLAAGVAALVISQNPAITAGRVREVLRASADKIGPLLYTGDPGLGGRNDEYGYGRVNALRAVQLAGDATITGFSPESGAVGGSIIITGTNLAAVTSVMFGTAPAQFVINSATSITATVPQLGTGPYSISVSTVLSTATADTVFTVVDNPTLTGFSPGHGAPGSQITIEGTNFVGVTSVRFGSLNAASFQVLSPTQIVATVPSTTSFGAVPIVVTAAGVTLTSSSLFDLHGLPQLASPALNLTTGTSGTPVKISGSNLYDVTEVKFGSYVATFTVDSPTQITAIVPTLFAPTTLLVTVVSQGQTLSAGNFNFVTGLSVTAMTPTSGYRGALITITGSNFYNITKVTIGNGTEYEMPFTVVSSTKITATVPAEAPIGGGFSAPVKVHRLGGSYGIVAGSFEVLEKPPKITSFTPAAGVVGTVVTITGTDLQDVWQAYVGTVYASHTVVSPTQVTVSIPADAVTAKIKLNTRWGSSVSTATAFTVRKPVISGFTPANGYPGTTITVTGSNLNGAGNMRIGDGWSLMNVVPDPVTPNTKFTATVGEYCTTGPLSVFFYNGGAVTNAQSTGSFTFKGATVTGSTPSSGSVATVVTINGTNLLGAKGVSFGNGPEAPVTIVSATQIKVTIPAGSTTGEFRVRVQTAGDTVFERYVRSLYTYGISP